MKLFTKVAGMLLGVCLFAAFVGCDDGGSKTPGGSVSIALNEYEISLDIGQTFTLTAEVSGGGSVEWESSDPSVATVDASGVVTGVFDGTARIYANVGEDRSECKVTVKEGLSGLPKLTLDISSTTIYTGYQKTITPVFKVGAEERAMDADRMTWKSSRESVATVSDGVVTGVAMGDALISLEYQYEGQTYTASLNVSVTDLAMLTLELEGGTNILASSKTYAGSDNAVGSAAVINVSKHRIFADEDRQTDKIDNSEVTFSVSDESIATVSETGEVRAKDKPGVVTITAEYGQLTGRLNLEVYTAIAGKQDLDMLAFADARGDTGAWEESAKYILVGDIDYQGELFIPIAAYTGAGGVFGGGRCISTGAQFASILGDGSKYGLTYEQLGTGGGLNPENRFFEGTIYGNGYAISNGKIMFDSYVDRSASLVASKWNVFGSFGGELRHIAFKNFAVQESAELTDVYPHNTQVYDISGALYTLTAPTDPSYATALRGAFAISSGFIADNAGVLEDVYIDITIPGGNAFTAAQTNMHMNAFIVRNTGTVRRVVVNWNWNGTHDGNQGQYELFETNTGTIEGLLAVWPKAGDEQFKIVADDQTPVSNCALAASEDAFDKDSVDLSGFTLWDTSGSGLPVLKDHA